MKKKILVLAHGDEPFLSEVLACLEGLDIEKHSVTECPVKSGVVLEWTPDAVIINCTLLNDESCVQHIKSLAKTTQVLAAERDSTVGRYIRMQILGARDYFHVPLDKKNLRNAVIDLLKLPPDIL